MRTRVRIYLEVIILSVTASDKKVHLRERNIDHSLTQQVFVEHLLYDKHWYRNLGYIIKQNRQISLILLSIPSSIVCWRQDQILLQDSSSLSNFMLINSEFWLNEFVLSFIIWASLVAQSVRNPPAMQETLVGKIQFRRKWQSTLEFLPGKLHGQRSLVSYSPGDCNESDMT